MRLQEIAERLKDIDIEVNVCTETHISFTDKNGLVYTGYISDTLDFVLSIRQKNRQNLSYLKRHGQVIFRLVDPLNQINEQLFKQAGTYVRDNRGEVKILRLTSTSDDFYSTHLIEELYPAELDFANREMKKLKHLLSVLPRSSRREFISDVEMIIKDMKAGKNSISYIRLVVFLHLCSVMYHAVFFKLNGYFYPASKRQQDK